MAQLLDPKEISPLFKIIPLLIILSLGSPGISYAQQKSPIDVVKPFNKNYAGPNMDELTKFTTANFRENKPKSVWVVDTWRSLQQLKYKKLNGDITNSKINGGKAVVIVQSRISTAAGDANQKEIYYLIKDREKWLVNELVVTDEEVDLDKIEL